MKTTKRVIALSLLTLSLNANEIQLKTGWNLIGVNSTDQVSELSKNQNILKAAGGGVGGGGDYRYDKSFAQFASGTMKLGQGYWINTNADTSLSYTPSSQTNTSIELLSGWNLINTCTEIDAKEILTKYPNVLKAAGGGVGGGGDFRYDKSFAQYATGLTKEGQGYWFKVDEPFSITCIAPFIYRTWGLGGDADNSKLTVMVNGVYYTLVAYSNLNIEQSNASTSPDITTFIGTLNSKPITNSFVISNDYNTHEVVIKVFSDENNMTNETLITQSQAITANNSYVTYDIAIQNADDYRPIQPTDTNIEMPPSAPLF